MRGLKNDEYSDGSNQHVTAKDAVFTLLAMDNMITDDDPGRLDWISNCYVDAEDPLSYHIHIDEDRYTPEKEVFPDFWTRLSIIILPEFFLNSSNPTISYTQGGVKCVGLYHDIESTEEWITYSKSAFGCGKYMIDYFIDKELTALKASPYWFGIGAIDGTKQDLDIETLKILHQRSDEFSLFKEGLLDIVKLGTTNTFLRKQFQSIEEYIVYSKPDGGSTFLAFNLDRPLIGGTDNFVFLSVPGKEQYTRGIVVRKAICHAIDREEINRVIHNGDYLISHSVVYPSNAFYYFDDILKYSYDLHASFEWLDSVSYYVGLSRSSLSFYLPILCAMALFVILKRRKM